MKKVKQKMYEASKYTLLCYAHSSQLWIAYGSLNCGFPSDQIGSSAPEHNEENKRAQTKLGEEAQIAYIDERSALDAGDSINIICSRGKKVFRCRYWASLIFGIIMKIFLINCILYHFNRYIWNFQVSSTIVDLGNVGCNIEIAILVTVTKTSRLSTLNNAHFCLFWIISM